MNDKLTTSAALLVVAFILHNGDHARRGISVVKESLVWAGSLTMVLAGVIVTLIVTRHHLAPMAAAAGGFAIAVGVSASHLLPDWGPISESLPQSNVGAFTWFAVLGEIAAAAWMGWVGLSQLRQSNFQLSV